MNFDDFLDKSYSVIVHRSGQYLTNYCRDSGTNHSQFWLKSAYHYAELANRISEWWFEGWKFNGKL